MPLFKTRGRDEKAKRLEFICPNWQSSVLMFRPSRIINQVGRSKYNIIKKVTLAEFFKILFDLLFFYN